MRQARVMLLILVIIGCSSFSMAPSAQSGSIPKDGELALPTDYKSFPFFLHGVQKPDAVRDLYVNLVDANTNHGQSFPNGTIMVMEIFSAKKDAEGNLAKGPDGKLIKGELAKVFVMQKEAGWGTTPRRT